LHFHHTPFSATKIYEAADNRKLEDDFRSTYRPKEEFIQTTTAQEPVKPPSEQPAPTPPPNEENISPNNQ